MDDDLKKIKIFEPGDTLDDGYVVTKADGFLAKHENYESIIIHGETREEALKHLVIIFAEYFEWEALDHKKTQIKLQELNRGEKF